MGVALLSALACVRFFYWCWVCVEALALYFFYPDLLLGKFIRRGVSMRSTRRFFFALKHTPFCADPALHLKKGRLLVVVHSVFAFVFA